LLLGGSLGRLDGKATDILEESKDSCERLVRLVSMFLNYSALGERELVLQLRETILRDCLDELSKRWSEVFQRKRRETDESFDPSIATFRFDYQKCNRRQRSSDNALKTYAERRHGNVRAAPHFWESPCGGHLAPVRRAGQVQIAAPEQRGSKRDDSGSGIAAEHHQEIFEDFVRVDRNTSGMGLGWRSPKRLIQAHRGKIWVASETKTGSRFTFLLRWSQG